MRQLNLHAGFQAIWVASALVIGVVSPVFAQGAAPAAPAEAPAAQKDTAQKVTVAILYAHEDRELPLPLSLLDLPPKDDGIAGAKLAINDNNTTGRFLNQEYTLDTVENNKPEELVAGVKAKVDAGMRFVVVDAAPDTLLAIADAVKGTGAVVFNASAPDDDLREERCRANVLHTAPTRSMLTDAVGQYLVWKKWTKWFLVKGTLPGDKAYAEQLRRTAKRYGASIVEEREYQFDSGSRRTDGGYEQVQQQIPQFTQGAKPHDVVMVADEGELFGEYIPYRTWEPRPVAGTAGLIAMSWHPALELWGGTQFQNRFQKLAKRTMRPLDYNAWLAVRAVGEAASRKRTSDAAALFNFMLSKDFELAGFKGVKTTFRDWNGQLRQPILVATPKLLVSVSPQPQFLHQFSELDTLGYDRPETKCKGFATK